MEFNIVRVKNALVQQWRILASDTNVHDKEIAYKNIIDYTNEIREHDKEFTLNEKALENYKEFKPKDAPQLDRKVKWAKYDESNRGLGETGDLEDQYNYYVHIAVRIVSKRHPDLDTDTDKFGTIVNATVHNLILLHKQ